LLIEGQQEKSERWKNGKWEYSQKDGERDIHVIGEKHGGPRPSGKPFVHRGRGWDESKKKSKFKG